MNILIKKYQNTLTVGLCIFLVIFFLAKSLNPWSNFMFESHDVTQPARIQQFTLNLQNLKIPPRLAPDFSFSLGYPVFNFYAPTAYWITSSLVILGFSIINAIKISYLLALIISFIGVYRLLKEKFDQWAAALGGIIYISSLYIAVDIFIRGNLAEVWFIALFPLALFLLNSKKSNLNSISILTLFVVAALFSSHNILSFLSLPIIFIYILITKKIKSGLSTIILALLINAYFLFPLAFESSLTHAQEIARDTSFQQHFLCLNQLWDSGTWGYGGSIEGCLDGMPFKLGKPQIILAAIGIFIALYQAIKKRKKILSFKNLFIFYLCLITGSLFLTLPISIQIWQILYPVFSLIQFPWRFLAFSLIGLAFFSAFFWDSLKFRAKPIVSFMLIIIILILHSKYFNKPQITNITFQKKYLSDEYIKNQAAYDIAEYLPRTVDYQYWREYGQKVYLGLERLPNLPLADTEMQYFYVVKNESFEKEVIVKNTKTVKLNIHYFPTWLIEVNGTKYSPKKFDRLGRPILTLNPKIKSRIRVNYQQTVIERWGNVITLTTLIIIIGKKLWAKNN